MLAFVELSGKEWNVVVDHTGTCKNERCSTDREHKTDDRL